MYVRAASGRQRYNALGAFNATTHQLIRVTNDTYIITGEDMLRSVKSG
jgi:hypothetical protein